MLQTTTKLYVHLRTMNVHFSIKTNGVYVRKTPDDSVYQFIRFFIEEEGNDSANNSLQMGTATGDLKKILASIKKSITDNAISFHFDDNDNTEVYWYAADEWHCMITVEQEGNAIMYTRTHPHYKKESFEYCFYPFAAE